MNSRLWNRRPWLEFPFGPSRTICFTCRLVPALACALSVMKNELVVNKMTFIWDGAQRDECLWNRRIKLTFVHLLVRSLVHLWLSLIHELETICVGFRRIAQCIECVVCVSVFDFDSSRSLSLLPGPNSRWRRFAIQRRRVQIRDSHSWSISLRASARQVPHAHLSPEHWYRRKNLPRRTQDAAKGKLEAQLEYQDCPAIDTGERSDSVESLLQVGVVAVIDFDCEANSNTN